MFEAKAKGFDPERNIEVKDCAICDVEFSPDDPRLLVELNC